jgi:GT2 family glycosyltransferase
MLDAAALAPARGARTETVLGVHLGTSIYRRSVFERIGMFDESFLYSEDVDLFLRVREADVPFTILREVMLYYRRHDGSMMVRKDARKTGDFRRAVARSIARRRRDGMQPVDLDMLEGHLEPRQ